MKIASKKELKQENARLKKINSSLKQQMKRLRKEQQDLQNQRGDLTERQKQIYNFISNNPGRCKQSIVNSSSVSRKPTFKIISELERYKMIIVRQDETNTQIHRVYINENSILSSVINQLDQFSREFSKLLDQLGKIVKNLNWPDQDYESLLTSIFIIFQHVANIHSVYGLLKWPGEIYDVELLNKLRVIVGVRLEQLQGRILEAFHLHTRISSKERLTMEMTYNPLVRNVASNIFLLKLEKMDEIIEPFKRAQLPENIINSVLDAAWKTSFDILLWTEYDVRKWNWSEHAMNKLRDWRFALESYKGQFI